MVPYRVNSKGKNPSLDSADVEAASTDEAGTPEDSAAWAKRVTGKLAGLLKDEMAAYGGGDAFMKWVRSDGEDDE